MINSFIKWSFYKTKYIRLFIFRKNYIFQNVLILHIIFLEQIVALQRKYRFKLKEIWNIKIKETFAIHLNKIINT